MRTAAGPIGNAPLRLLAAPRPALLALAVSEPPGSPGAARRDGEEIADRYTVWDNSGVTQDAGVVFAGRRAVAAGVTDWGPARRGVVYYAKWRVPRRTLKNVRFCVLSQDEAGNESNVSCAKVVITK